MGAAGWQDRTLGDLVKVLPAGETTKIHSFLVMGGWLVEVPPEAAEGSSRRRPEHPR